MTRDEADGGETTRACLGGATTRVDEPAAAGALALAERPLSAGEEFLPVVAPETLADEAAGTLLFTKRCSLAS